MGATSARKRFGFGAHRPAKACEIVPLQQPATYWCCSEFPNSRSLPSEKGVDDGHVAHGVFERDGRGFSLENRTRERLRFQRVLIHRVERDRFDAGPQAVAPVVDENSTGTIGGSVVRNLDLDATACSEDLGALVEDELRAAHEEGLPTRKLEQRRGETVRSEFGIPLHERKHASRLFTEQETRRDDRVTADIHERAAAHSGTFRTFFGSRLK